MEQISGIVLVNELNSILVKCIQLLNNPDAASLHETRKSMKMFRALVRLLKYSISPATYSALNTEARDISRLLAGYRDYDSAIEACLRNNAKLSSYQKNLNTRVKNKILTIGRQERQGVSESAVQAIKGVELLKELISEIDGNAFTSGHILEAYLQMYKKNKKWLSFVSEVGSVEEFHEWRKQVKYLRYQITFLLPVWPGYCRFMEIELHTLSDILGNMQDNKLVKELLGKRQLLKKDAYAHYSETIDSLNQLLKSESIHLGKKLFACSVKSERAKMC